MLFKGFVPTSEDKYSWWAAVGFIYTQLTVYIWFSIRVNVKFNAISSSQSDRWVSWRRSSRGSATQTVVYWCPSPNWDLLKHDNEPFADDPRHHAWSSSGWTCGQIYRRWWIFALRCWQLLPIRSHCDNSPCRDRRHLEASLRCGQLLLYSALWWL